VETKLGEFQKESLNPSKMVSIEMEITPLDFFYKNTPYGRNNDPHLEQEGKSLYRMESTDISPFLYFFSTRGNHAEPVVLECSESEHLRGLRGYN